MDMELNVSVIPTTLGVNSLVRTATWAARSPLGEEFAV